MSVDNFTNSNKLPLFVIRCLNSEEKISTAYSKEETARTEHLLIYLFIYVL